MTLPTDFRSACDSWPALASIRESHGDEAAKRVHTFFERLSASGDEERYVREREALDLVWGPVSNEPGTEAAFEMSRELGALAALWDQEVLRNAAPNMSPSARLSWMRFAVRLREMASEVQEALLLEDSPSVVDYRRATGKGNIL